MLSRKNTIYIILIGCISVLTFQALWMHGIWSASNVEISSVKGVNTEKVDSPTLKPYPNFNQPSNFNVYSKQFVLLDETTGKILTQSQNDGPAPVASTTKMMTSLLVTKNADLQEKVTISDEAATQIGSLMEIYTDEVYTVNQLLYGTLMVSGNDAAYALGEYIGGKLLNNPSASSIDKINRFVEEMNKEAALLHMQNTSFKDPAGLNDEGKSSAFDMAKLLGVLLKDRNVTQIIRTSDYNISNASGGHVRSLKNSNRLVGEFNYSGIIGGKTGYTPDAGHCLIASATRDNHTLIVAILNTFADTNDASAVEARRLLDYGFANTSWQ